MNVLLQLLELIIRVGCLQGEGDYDHCAGSAFHAVTAALATQGYWMQADILWHINFTGFQIIAIIVYLFACIGGIVGMALGSPPRNWLWLVIGPGMFLFLVDTTTPAYGVRWYVGPGTGDGSANSRQERAMRKVWRLAEAGLANMHLSNPGPSIGIFGAAVGIGSTDMQFYNNSHPTGNNRTRGGADPDGSVRVAWVFYWADWVVSDFVEWMIDWTGVFSGGVPRSALVANSNLPIVGISTENALSFLNGGDAQRQDDEAWMLSNSKWTYVMDITGAQLHNGDLRDAFVTFMASECGDALGAGIDKQAYTSAQTSKGLNLPATVFKAGQVGGLYQPAIQHLVDTHIPTPPSIIQLLKARDAGGFGAAFDFLRDDALATEFLNSGILESISCDQLLTLVVEGFRWEAAHQYYQLLTSLPPSMSPLTMMYQLFYGWDMRREASDIFAGWGIDAPATVSWAAGTVDLPFAEGGWAGVSNLASYVQTAGQQGEFLQNLIFVHLLRNELALAPKPFRGRISQSSKAIVAVEKYQAQNGSRSKFGEIYTWAQMIPYMQGVLLYIIAIAYPFICMITLIPGQQKALFTWFSFFVWAKLWDVGFAVVMVLERSIWAMLGNGPNTGRVFSRILSMEGFGDTQIECQANPLDPLSFVTTLLGLPVPYSLCAPGTSPIIMVGAEGTPTDPLILENVLRYLDQGLSVGANLQLDVANSYYVYIMAALYFGVPAVTGQAVLGAKAGAAGLATSAIGGSASEAGRAAGQGFVGGQSRIAQQNSGVGQHATKMAAMRSSGYGAAAVSAGASALSNDLLSTAASGENNQIRQQAAGFDRGAQAAQAQTTAALGIGRAAVAGAATGLQHGKDLGGAFFRGELSTPQTIADAALGIGGLPAAAQLSMIPDEGVVNSNPAANYSGSGNQSSSLSSSGGIQSTNPSQNSRNSQNPSSQQSGNGQQRVGSGRTGNPSVDDGMGNSSAGGQKDGDFIGGVAGLYAQGNYAAGQIAGAEVGYLRQHANTQHDARQADAMLNQSEGQLFGAAFKASSDQYSQMADAHAGQATHDAWKDDAVDMAEHLSAIGGNGASIQGTTQGLASSANAAASMGYLGSDARQAANYRANGAVGTASSYMGSLRGRYGSAAVMESFQNGMSQAHEATSQGLRKYPAVRAALAVGGGVPGVERLSQNTGSSARVDTSQAVQSLQQNPVTPVPRN